MSDEITMPSRIDVLKQAFGQHAEAFNQNLDDAAKAHFEAYKFKLAQQQPVFRKRAELAAQIPHFWSKSLENCKATAQFIDPVDQDALKALKEVEITHGDDVREYDIKFTFGKNPYFKESTLTKKVVLTPPADLKPAPEPASPYDLEAPVYLGPKVAISWTSADHDLTKKAPRTDPEEKEEFDEFGGPGSFFGFFGVEGEDPTGLGEVLLEWYAHATEYAAGLTALLDEDSDDGAEFDFDEFDSDDDESDGDDADPKKEIDLDNEDAKRPKKKQRR
ncbi:hypothetical protein BMF94_0692 [Rhodotorula taiwanensis]|uniref:Uncharacterized protein n=1 Tax=Rhodotorula taiwanensis TaxID=741276 RepID=A0A2S5BI91_9BASI|nr:hypothetical protein BMF94_0692 [Rhodotorula taiwanensis]